MRAGIRPAKTKTLFRWPGDTVGVVKHGPIQEHERVRLQGQDKSRNFQSKQGWDGQKRKQSSATVKTKISR